MANIFKRKRRVTGADGKTKVKKSSCYYIDYRDANGILRRVKGFTDRAATEQRASELERLAARTETGLVDPYAEHKKTPLREHVAAFREYLARTKSPRTGRHRTTIHVSKTISRVLRVLEGCQFAFWGDIEQDRVEIFLGENVLDPKTHNHFVTALRMFCNWMVDHDRAEKSPLGKLQRVKARGQKGRRAFTFQEFLCLLAATERAPFRYGMSGHERAVLYLLDVETGFRVGELRSLTISSFDFENAVVRVAAEFCKNREEAEQLLKQKRAEQLREFFSGKLPGAKAFNIPTHFRTAEMLHADCRDAGIEIENGRGKIVFYSLRHTLATNLDKTGASLKERMAIMRHSDRSSLTLGTYTDAPRPYDLRRVIENLPDYPWPGTEDAAQAVATGTDGATDEWTGKWTVKWTETPSIGRQRMSSKGNGVVSADAHTGTLAANAKSSETRLLGTDGNRMSLCDTAQKKTGPGWIRTSDQGIMSPLLYR